MLGSDVFASQPPGFYVLLRIAGALGGASLHDLRVAFLVICLGGIAAAWAAARPFGGPLGGLAAAALLAVAVPWVNQLARVSADAPSVALALVAVALGAHGLRREGSVAAAALAGAVLVAAVSVKLFAATALVPLAATALAERADRRRVLAALLGGAVVAVAFVAAYAGVLGDLWRQAVDFHREARSLGGGSSARRILESGGTHTPFSWVAVAAAVLAVAALVVRRPTRTWPLWSWVVVAALYLLWQRPLFDHHLVLFAAPLAVAAGATLGAVAELVPRPALVAAGAVLGAVVAAAALVQQHRRLAEVATGPPPDLAWAAGAVRACTPAGSAIVSDQPLVAVLADRRLDGALVDTSEVRLASGSLSTAEIERALGRARAVYAGRSFRSRPTLLADFRARLGPPRRHGDVSLYC